MAVVRSIHYKPACESTFYGRTYRIKFKVRCGNRANRTKQSKAVSKAQVALAWVLSQNVEIVTISGTRKINRLEENLSAFNVELAKTDLAAIDKSILSKTIGNRF